MIRVRNVFMSVTSSFGDLKKENAKKLKISETLIEEIKINHKSLDARKSKDIHYVYEVDVSLINEDKFLGENNSSDVFLAPLEKYNFNYSKNIKLNKRPIIVEAGPAGLFCSYLLAEAGLILL